MTALVRRVSRLGRRELGDFAEALVALTVAYWAIRLLPFRTVVRTMSIGRIEPGRSAADEDQLAGEVRQAIRRAAKRLPWTVVCFPQGLAAHWLLRRRGAPSRVHYGVRPAEASLSAHVWVTLGGRTVIGEEGDERHAEVAVFP